MCLPTRLARPSRMAKPFCTGFTKYFLLSDDVLRSKKPLFHSFFQCEITIQKSAAVKNIIKWWKSFENNIFFCRNRPKYVSHNEKIALVKKVRVKEEWNLTKYNKVREWSMMILKILKCVVSNYWWEIYRIQWNNWIKTHYFLHSSV